MFYIHNIDGESIRYDPIEFRAARDVQRLHRRAIVPVDTEGAVVIERSTDTNADSTLLSYSPRRRSAENVQAGLESRSVVSGDDPLEISVEAPSVAPALFEDTIEVFNVDVIENDEDGELAREIMSSPVRTLKPSSGLREASAIFRELRYRYVPVVSEDNKLVGIVSDRDFLRATEPAESNAALDERPEKVADIMVRNVLSARPQAEISAISQVLFSERIGAMPIVDKKGQLKGMVTRSDLLRAMVGPINKSGTRTTK